MVGEGAAVAVDDTAGADTNAFDNFIWSDLNYGNNTGTATGTNEWTNGYLLFATTTKSASL